MSTLFNDFLSVNIVENEIKSHYTAETLNSMRKAEDSLRILYASILPSVEIANITKLPKQLEHELNSLTTTFLEFYNKFQGICNRGDQGEIQRESERIQQFQNGFFEINSSNRYVGLFAYIKNYESKVASTLALELETAKKDYESINRKLSILMDSLENPSATKILSDYAKDFEKEELKYNDASKKWLIASFIILIAFIAIVIISIIFNWFPSKIELLSTNENKITKIETINIPMIFTKLFIFSLIAYVVFFCFRQYSIFKNLALINQQRKTAFNSLELFNAAIGDSDKEAKKILLTSLAKTIHGNVSTGLLNTNKSESTSILNSIDLGSLTKPS